MSSSSRFSTARPKGDSWQREVAVPILCPGSEPPPPAGLPVVVSYRVDDGPSHDGTGNDSKGNNDGLAQCGETIELYRTIRNDGEGTLTGIRATLREPDPYVRLLYNTSSAYPNLPVGASVENPRDWDFEVGCRHPERTQIHLHAHLHRGQRRALGDNGPGSHRVRGPRPNELASQTA